MGKRILVIGGGGREHALGWKIIQSPEVEKIFCVPGNAGIAQIADCFPRLSIEAIHALADLAEEKKIDLTIVGPEGPLAVGIVNEFNRRGLKIFGPTKEAALIEGSKIFAKEMVKYFGIPTAEFWTVTDPGLMKLFSSQKLPCVIKADGLASGKGSIPCFSRGDIEEAVKRIMIEKEFGEAGDRALGEKFLEGEEATIKVLTDGTRIIPLLPTQDHKRLYYNDEGPNTGGMGAYAPAPVINPELEAEITTKIMLPAIRGMVALDRTFRGVLYGGLMITSGKPKVLEFNCRFGDPELQPIVMLMENDLMPILEAVSEGNLKGKSIKWRKGAAVCVIMASGGYPGTYKKGMVIKGLKEVAKMENVAVFHAGTAQKNSEIITNGGRVLGVTAWGTTIEEATDLAYEGVDKISWQGEHHRTDIARRALERKTSK